MELNQTSENLTLSEGKEERSSVSRLTWQYLNNQVSLLIFMIFFWLVHVFGIQNLAFLEDDEYT